MYSRGQILGALDCEVFMGLPVLPFFIHLLMLTSTQEPHFLIGFIFDDFVIEANSVLTGAVCFFCQNSSCPLSSEGLARWKGL